MIKQFTATAFVINDENKVLLVFHRKLRKWLPPGGHLEENETPVEGARREVLEETGLEIEFIRQENVWINRWNANSFERPYLCMIEEINAYGPQDVPHQHIDFVYLAKPTGGRESQNLQETEGMHWFSLEEVEALAPDNEIFVDTQQILRQIFSSLEPVEKSL